MCECVNVYMPISLYFGMYLYKYIFATQPHSMDEWIEETQTDQNYVRYNLYACPKQANGHTI